MSTKKQINFYWLTRYPWVSSFVGLGALSLAASGYFWNELPTLEAELSLKTKEGEIMLDAVASSPVLKSELANVAEAASRIESNVVDELAVDVNYGYFYSLEKRTGARLSDLQPINGPGPDPRSPYKLVSFTLRLSGSYEQVAEYLQQLEIGPRLVRINQFAFSRQGPASDSIVLDLTLDLLGKR